MFRGIRIVGRNLSGAWRRQNYHRIPAHKMRFKHLMAIPGVLLAYVTTLVAGQADDAAIIVQKTAENIERTSAARRQYIYDKMAATGLWVAGLKASHSAQRHETMRFVVTGVYGQTLAMDGLAGECKESERTQRYTQPGFSCKGVEKIAGPSDSLLASLLDEGKSLDGVPYWLLPLRPAYLKFFQFTLRGKGELHGRPVYIIDFKPAHGTSPKLPRDDPYYGASAWRGTAWVDEEEAQLARLESTGSNPARGLFGHTFFGIEFARVTSDVWFPTVSCNVLGGDPGEKAWPK